MLNQLDSMPLLPTSQLTPLRRGSPHSLRAMAMVAQSEVPQLGASTCDDGFQLPSGSCQEERSFQARSAAGSPVRARAA